MSVQIFDLNRNNGVKSQVKLENIFSIFDNFERPFFVYISVCSTKHLIKICKDTSSTQKHKKK